MRMEVRACKINEISLKKTLIEKVDSICDMELISFVRELKERGIIENVMADC